MAKSSIFVPSMGSQPAQSIPTKAMPQSPNGPVARIPTATAPAAKPTYPIYRQPKPMAGAKVMGSFKKGGTIPKTGTYKLHKGEKVVTAKEIGSKEKKSNLVGRRRMTSDGSMRA